MKKYLLIALLLMVASPPAAHSQADQAYIGEIHVFAGNYAPNGWALCNGQLMSIAQNTALFSLLGTTYGGDGVQTFGLPDLRGRVPMHLSATYAEGLMGGEEAVTLTQSQLPAHSHGLSVDSREASSAAPVGAAFAKSRGGVPVYGTSPTGHLAANAVSTTGGGQSHNNLQPYMALNYIIALQGIFPSRSAADPKAGKTVNGAEPLLGQVLLVPYNFAPNGWADCNGQLLSIAQNQALFALLGTTYGGNGQTNFALPDLQGRVPVDVGNVLQGEYGGEATHTLTQSEMPSHSHSLTCAVAADLAGPADAYASRTENALMMFGSGNGDLMNGAAVTSAGLSQSHDNMKPYLTMRYIIAMAGIFPSRP